MKDLTKAITLGGVRYPNFNNVAIIMGGMISHGARFYVVDEMLMMEGVVFDRLKLRDKAFRTKITKKKFKDDWGVDIDTLDINNPKDLKIIDDCIFKWSDVKNRIKNSVVRGIRNANPRRKPNVIISEMLKDEIAFVNYCIDIGAIGYNKKDMHLIWKVGDFASDQELGISRGCDFIDVNLLRSAHERIAMFMSDIFTGNTDISKFMDGDIWIVFGRTDAVQIKKSGLPIDKDKIDYQLVTKIIQLIPNKRPLKFR